VGPPRDIKFANPKEDRGIQKKKGGTSGEGFIRKGVNVHRQDEVLWGGGKGGGGDKKGAKRKDIRRNKKKKSNSRMEEKGV